MLEQFASNTSDYFILAAYLLPVALIWLGREQRRRRRLGRQRAVLEENRAAGLGEPISLHPAIEASKCIGCGTCAAACPEGDVLGVINGRAALVNPTHCIGHGACAAACPVGAISLVFGSEKRGVDIPHVDKNFETNVPGLFIAGELGGMGLIRNAVEQGRQAMEAIRKKPGVGTGNGYDVVIVGAGPAGFAATLAAKQYGLRYVTVEQETLGGTVSHYPRGKVVMTQPVELPLVGKVKFGEVSKETLLAFWQKVEQESGVEIRYQERMEAVNRQGDGFLVHTSGGQYPTRAVLLAVGRRGTPRKLGVPGEAQSKVVYRLIDPEQYRGRRVLVVGGGDSALEAALALADEPGTTVSLSYRGEAFGRAKEKNRKRVEEAGAQGRMRVMLNSNVTEIGSDRVRMEAGGEDIELPNDAVIVNAGGILPTAMLKQMGIAVETKYGEA